MFILSCFPQHRKQTYYRIGFEKVRTRGGGARVRKQLKATLSENERSGVHACARVARGLEQR